MSDSITVIIILAVAVIAVAVVVALSFSKINMGKQVDSSATESLSSTISQFDDPTKQVYDNMVVTGAEVKEVIDEYKRSQDCSIKVVTKAEGADKAGSCVDDISKGTLYVQKAEWTTNGTSNDKTQSVTNSPSQSINENGTFKGYIRRDVNDAITLIAFVQQ